MSVFKKSALVGLLSMVAIPLVSVLADCPPVSALQNVNGYIQGKNSDGMLFAYHGYFNYKDVGPANEMFGCSCVYTVKSTQLGYNLMSNPNCMPPPRATK